jgi:hypothetical protein
VSRDDENLVILALRNARGRIRFAARVVTLDAKTQFRRVDQLEGMGVDCFQSREAGLICTAAKREDNVR